MLHPSRDVKDTFPVYTTSVMAIVGGSYWNRPFKFYVLHKSPYRYWFQSHALKWRLMIVPAYQISGKSTVCLTVCSDWQLRKHQSFALLALYGRWIPITSQWCKKKIHAIRCQGTKWPPFHWRTFQIHFLEWRYSYFESKFIEICSQLSN